MARALLTRSPPAPMRMSTSASDVTATASGKRKRCIGVLRLERMLTVCRRDVARPSAACRRSVATPVLTADLTSSGAPRTIARRLAILPGRKCIGTAIGGFAMDFGFVRRARRAVLVGLGTALALTGGFVAPGSQALSFHPLVAEYQFLSASTTPPTEPQCFSVGRRCFAPASMQNSYNLGPLYAQGLNGNGQTIVIVDSYGSDTIRTDLHVFDTAFNLQPMCGEANVACKAGMPTFDTLALQGSPA